MYIERYEAPRLVLITNKVAAANLRFGDGVAREVGMDFKNMQARKVDISLDLCAV